MQIILRTATGKLAGSSVEESEDLDYPKEIYVHQYHGLKLSHISANLPVNVSKLTYAQQVTMCLCEQKYGFFAEVTDYSLDCLTGCFKWIPHQLH